MGEKKIFGISQVFPEDLGFATPHTHEYQIQWSTGLENHRGPEQGGVVLTFS